MAQSPGPASSASRQAQPRSPGAISSASSSHHVQTASPSSAATTTAADAISLCSTTSALSSCPDRHGFYGGAQFSAERPRREPLSRAQIVAREKKWLYMIANYTDYLTKNYKKIRARCRKGIPQSVRARAWFHLSGANMLHDKHPTLYADLLQQPGNAQCIDEIRRDQHRQFPLHEMFLDADRPGQQELFNVLKAYSILNPRVGYCQAQAPIAAFLLMHMPAEQAFWCFVSVCDKYLADYYAPGMEMLQRDAAMLNALLHKTAPAVHRHLQKHRVEPLLYMTDWFLCAMTRTLPWDTLLRVWDCFLCEGVKVVFKVALVILGGTLSSPKVRKRCAGLCETLEVLRGPDARILEEEYVMYHMERLSLSIEDFKVEHERQAAAHRKLKLAKLMDANNGGGAANKGAAGSSADVESL